MGANYFLENIVLFVQMLRQAGLPVSTEQAMEFSRALTLIDIGSREHVYHTARSLLINRHEHLQLFDVLFNRFWRRQINAVPQGQKAPLAPRHDRREHRPLLMTYMARKAKPDEPEIEVVDKSGTFSRVEILQHKDFSDMTEEELQEIRRLIQTMRWQVSLRQTRRRVPDARGQTLHLRRVLASAARHGGTPIRLFWQTRKHKQRPIVLLADVSGSMEKYSRLVLQFFYAVSHSLRNVECFVFGTRLTRITPQLKLRNIDRAVEQAAREVVDWSGGTRIGDSLRQFNRQWSRRVLGRGAVVLIISDGWERGDSTVLGQELQFLQLRCHHLIWLNPLMGKSTYQPTVEGMQVALRFVDDFLPVHDFRSLSSLANHLKTLNTPIIKRRQI
jgi:uncharacterized protein with von Willebrand factor type A (vWA) domain